MPIVKKIEGDLFDTEETWVLQQCNCVTVRSHGLSASIDRKWGVNPYQGRHAMGRRNCAMSKDMDVPGTIKIMDSDDGTKKIICAFAQWAPGKPGHYDKYYPTPPRTNKTPQNNVCHGSKTVWNTLTWTERWLCLTRLAVASRAEIGSNTNEPWSTAMLIL